MSQRDLWIDFLVPFEYRNQARCLEIGSGEPPRGNFPVKLLPEHLQHPLPEFRLRLCDVFLEDNA